MQIDLREATESLDLARHICVISHISPDGDAIGSLLGLTLALRASGKQVTPCMHDDVPTTFSFLPGNQEIVKRLPEEADVFVTVDCADIDRIGEIARHLPGKPHINIDHHISNTHYANINLVDTQLSSTAEYVMCVLGACGLKIDQEVATCLLTGIVTDTLGFRTSNTKPETLAAAQALMESRASLHDIYERTLHQRSLPATRLWGHALSSVQSRDGLVWASLPLSVKADAGYTATGDADVVSQLTAIHTTDVAVVFVERPAGEIKISWRSTTGLDVAQLASTFGGGGHSAAAGANLHKTTLADAEREVLSRTRIALQSFRQNGTQDGPV